MGLQSGLNYAKIAQRGIEMEIPGRIVISGLECLVEEQETENSSRYGQADLNKNKIIIFDIKGDCPESQQAATFLHEIIEVIDFHHSIGLDHDKLTVLSQVLFGVIRGNWLDFRSPDC